MKTQHATRSPSVGAKRARQISTIVAYLLALAAPVGYIHGWYSNLAWGPSLVVSHTWWLLIRTSLLVGFASALVASFLAARQDAGKWPAFASLVGTTLLLPLSDAYISSFPLML